MLECLGMANRMFVEQQGSNVQLLLRMFGEKVYIYIYIYIYICIKKNLTFK
jgi:hypothetical protein